MIKMSTNYYFKWKNYNLERTLNEIKNYLKLCRLSSSEIFDILDNYEYELKNLNMIHIGKRGYGMKPSFEKTKYYSSVKEIIQFYEDNKDDIEIINEYNEKLTIEKLRRELIDIDGEERVANKHIYTKDYLDEDGYYFIEGDFT